jgi:hypothetical protein
MRVWIYPDVSSTTSAVSGNISGLGAIGLTQPDGVTALTTQVVAGQEQCFWYTGADGTTNGKFAQCAGANGSFVRHSVSYSATITPTCTASVATQEDFEIGSLTGTLTINAPSGCQAGSDLIFFIPQDAGGGHAVTWDSSYHSPPAIDATATGGKIATATFYYNGNGQYMVGGVINQ